MKVDFYGDLYVTEANGLVQEFAAGGGANSVAQINTNANVQLTGIALLENGSLIVSDAGNQVIWQIPSGGTNPAVLLTGVLGVSGTNFGAAGIAKLNTPMRLVPLSGGKFLIADSGNNRVVVASDSGAIASALSATNADLWFGLSSDPVGPSSVDFGGNGV
jgi:hypothetical protein